MQCRYFDYMSVSLIIINTLVVGLQVEASAHGHKETFWDNVEFCNGAAFSVEVIIRMFALGGRFFWDPDKDHLWNYLDITMVMMNFVEVVIDISGAAGNSLQNLLVMRLARLVRIIRVVRVVRLLRFLRPLRLLVHSIFGTLKTLVWVVLLLVAIIYAFSVVFTQAIAEMPVESQSEKLQRFFGTLPKSLATLFKSITGGVNWEPVADALEEVGWLYVVFFVSYIVFALFAVLNVMTGHFCQGAIESAVTDQNEVIEMHLANTAKYTTQLRDLFQQLDPSGLGEVTLEGFQKLLKDPRLKAYCETLEIQVFDAWTVFKLLDTDGSHVIDLEEFVQGCVQIRGYAKTIGIKEILYELKMLESQVASLHWIREPEEETPDTPIGKLRL